MNIPFSFVFKTQNVSEDGKLRGGFVATNRHGNRKTYHTSDKSGTGHGLINESVLEALLQQALFQVGDVRSPETATPLVGVDPEFLEALDASFTERNTKQKQYPRPKYLLAHCQFVQQVFGIKRSDYSPANLSEAWADLLVGNPVTTPSKINIDLGGKQTSMSVGRGTQFFDLEIQVGHTSKCVSVKTCKSLKDTMRVSTISQEAAALWQARIDNGERMPTIPVIMIYPSKDGLVKTQIDGNIFHHSDTVRVAIGNINWNSATFVTKGGTVDVHAQIARSHKSTINWNIKGTMPKPLEQWLCTIADENLGQPKGA